MSFDLDKKAAVSLASTSPILNSAKKHYSGKKHNLLNKCFDKSVFSRMRTERGFTLIELLVVIVIIGVLMSAIMMNSMIARDKARISACKATLDTVKKGMQIIITEKNEYPDAGSIGSYADIMNLMKDDVNLSPKITCEEPFVYTTNDNRSSYRLQTLVHYAGSAGAGVQIILEDGAISDKPL